MSREGGLARKIIANGPPGGTYWALLPSRSHVSDKMNVGAAEDIIAPQVDRRGSLLRCPPAPPLKEGEAVTPVFLWGSWLCKGSRLCSHRERRIAGAVVLKPEVDVPPRSAGLMVRPLDRPGATVRCRERTRGYNGTLMLQDLIL